MSEQKVLNAVGVAAALILASDSKRNPGEVIDLMTKAGNGDVEAYGEIHNLCKINEK